MTVQLLRRTSEMARGRTDATSGPILVALIAAVVIAAILVPALDGGPFLTADNIRGILIRSVSLGLVAVGQTLVIVGGSIDLSVAYTVSVSAVLASFVMQGDPNRVPQALAVCLIVGVVVGLVNGLSVTKLRINPLMATLATGLLMQGFLNASFDNFAGSVPESFQVLGYARIGPIPLSVLLLGVVGALAWVLLARTRTGAHLYAVGGDRELARLSGVRADRVQIGAHVLCSLCSVLAGLYIVSRLQSGAPWVGPDGGYDLESIAAVVMGGTALLGGRGGVIGTLAGVVLLAVLDSVFNLLEVGGFLKEVVRGVIIIVAVALYSAQRLRTGRVAGAEATA